MSPATAWDHLASCGSKITNLDQHELHHLLHVYSHDRMARYQFHYYEGEAVVYPPPDEPPHNGAANKVWQFASRIDAEVFINALDAYWMALGLRDHVRIFARTGQQKSYMA